MRLQGGIFPDDCGGFLDCGNAGPDGGTTDGGSSDGGTADAGTPDAGTEGGGTTVACDLRGAMENSSVSVSGVNLWNRCARHDLLLFTVYVDPYITIPAGYTCDDSEYNLSTEVGKCWRNYLDEVLTPSEWPVTNNSTFTLRTADGTFTYYPYAAGLWGTQTTNKPYNDTRLVKRADHRYELESWTEGQPTRQYMIESSGDHFFRLKEIFDGDRDDPLDSNSPERINNSALIFHGLSGNVTSVLTSRGQWISFTRDTFDKVNTVKDPYYDSAKPREHSYEFTYNNNNRLEKVRYPARLQSDTTDLQEIFTYVNGTGPLQERKFQPSGGTILGKTVFARESASDHRIKEIARFSGTSTTPASRIGYASCGNDTARDTTVTLPTKLEYRYHLALPANNIARIENIYDKSIGRTTQYEYNARGQVLKEFYLATGTTTQVGTQYTYQAGNAYDQIESIMNLSELAKPEAQRIKAYQVLDWYFNQPNKYRLQQLVQMRRHYDLYFRPSTLPDSGGPRPALETCPIVDGTVQNNCNRVNITRVYHHDISNPDQRYTDVETVMNGVPQGVIRFDRKRDRIAGLMLGEIGPSTIVRNTEGLPTLVRSPGTDSGDLTVAWTRGAATHLESSKSTEPTYDVALADLDGFGNPTRQRELFGNAVNLQRALDLDPLGRAQSETVKNASGNLGRTVVYGYETDKPLEMNRIDEGNLSTQVTVRRSASTDLDGDPASNICGG